MWRRTDHAIGEDRSDQTIGSAAATLNGTIYPRSRKSERQRGGITYSPIRRPCLGGGAKHVIVFLNAYGSTQLDAMGAPGIDEPCYDVDGNNIVAPLDALLVINALNAGTVFPEPPSASEMSPQTSLPFSEEECWSTEDYMLFELMINDEEQHQTAARRMESQS
jgi:hypothetical protein